MAERLKHDDVMELAVELACSYLSASGSPNPNAEDLIVDYYKQIRNAEARLGITYTHGPEEEEATEREERAAAA